MSCACTGAFQLRNMPCGRWSDDWVSSNVLKTGKLCAVPGGTHHAGLIPLAAMPRAKSAEQCDAKNACENLGDDLVKRKGFRTGYFIYVWFCLLMSHMSRFKHVILCIVLKGTLVQQNRVVMSESDCSLFCADNGMPATTYFIRKITTRNALAS
jgi:hypothetical protein